MLSSYLHVLIFNDWVVSNSTEARETENIIPRDGAARCGLSTVAFQPPSIAPQ